MLEPEVARSSDVDSIINSVRFFPDDECANANSKADDKASL